MRFCLLLTVASFLTFTFSLNTVASAIGSTSAERIPATTTTSTFSGRVMGPDGPLPGAVVEVVGTKFITVTNANGEFNLTVPKRRTPLRLTASYAGFVDETLTLSAPEPNITLELATPKTIKVARNQRLKNYVKMAQRDVKRDLRTVK